MRGVVDDALPTDARFLRACRRLPVDATPIWLMRQAGRYMTEYQELRRRYSFEQLLTQPELACEVTLQPVRALGVDAAIVFSDILPILRAMGMSLRYDDSAGPQLEPLGDREPAALSFSELEERLGYTLQTLRLVKRELTPPGVPLIGFAGAPFTLACYALEGRPSSACTLARGLLLAHPERGRRLLAALADTVGRHLVLQARTGADALQLFDTWAGTLAAADYRELALPAARRAIALAREAGVPVIYFSTQTGGMLELLAETGADVIGVDWRTDLAAARRRLGGSVAVQGNLDPAALLASWETLAERARAVLRAAGRGPGFIFNLGHGVLPGTDPDNVRRLVELVHEESPLSGLED